MKTFEKVQMIAEAAVACERATGVPAELSAVQCALESGWLGSCPGLNCFGIKYVPSRHKKFTELRTQECVRGQMVEVVAKFAAYDSIEECFTDHARLLTRPTGVYAAPLSRFREDGDFPHYVRNVAKYYATDPGYADKVLRIARDPLLTKAIAAARARV